MSQVTGESVKSAISRRIVRDFTVDGIAPVVYKEQVLQGFEKPSFFIWTVDISQDKRMLNNYTRTYQMEVRYHMADGRMDAYEHLCSVGNTLLESLAYIDIPVGEIVKPVKGTKMRFTINDDVLLVYVTYTMNIYKQLSLTPSMENLDIIC